MNSNRILGLDILRALAISLVIVAHAGFPLLSVFPNLGKLCNASAFLGVELFFVLSGYLIGSILLKHFATGCSFEKLRTFWVRRWMRTLPNYFLFLIINLLIAFILNTKVDHPWRYPLFLQNLYEKNQEFFPESWSLSVEEWFYILYPITLMAVMGKLKASYARKVLVVTAMFLIATSVIRFVYPWIDSNYQQVDMRRSVIFRLDAPIYGVMGAILNYFEPERWRRLAPVMLSLGISALFVGLFGISDMLSDRLPSFFSQTGLFSVISLSFLLMLPVFSLLRSSKSRLAPMVTSISLWSYSLYLCHVPIGKVMHYFFDSSIGGSSHLAIAFTVLYLVTCILMAALCYRYFEKPVMDLRERIS